MKGAVSKIYLLTLFIYVQINAQSPLYKNFTVKDGLPSSTVYSICQDREGFIWIGSNNGVSRFDGINFKVFTTDAGLPDNIILKIYEDKRNRIWFLSLNGKLSFYKNGAIHNEKTDRFLKEASMQTPVSTYNEDNEGNVWFYNTTALKMIDKNDSVHVYDNSYFFNNLHFKFSDMSIPWIDTHGRLSFFCRGAKLVSYIRKGFSEAKASINIDAALSNLTKKDQNYNYNVMAVLRSTNGKVIVSNNSAIIIFKENKVFQSYNCDYLKNNNVVTILEDNEKNIWLSTIKGLIFFEKGILNDKYKIFFDKVYFGNGIQDNEGNIWFGTLGNGLFIIPIVKAFIFNNENASQNNMIIKLGISSAGSIIAGTVNGNLFKYDSTSAKFVALSNYNSRNSNSFYGIFSDHNNGTWIITGNNISIYNGKDFHYYSDTMSWFKSAVVAKNGSIWIGGGHNLAEFKDGNFYERYHFNQTIRMYSLLETGDSLLIGTEKGLYVYRKGQMISLAKNNTAFETPITDLISTQIGIIWAATRGGGIFVISKGVITSVRKKDGLLSDNITKLLVTKNLVYAANGTGVNRIEYKIGADGKIYPDNISSVNIPLCEVNDLLLKDSMIWMATNIGIIKWPLEKKEFKLPPAPSYITGFIVNHKSLPIQNDYDLSYLENNVEIRFTGITYSSFGPVNFRYRLSRNVDWSYTHSSSVVLPSLPSGHYSFEVQTQNANGNWNNASALVRFHINAPFWMQWWFIALSNALLLLFITSLLWLRVKRIRREEKIKQKNLRTELQALRAQLNPHFIFNSLNSIQDFVLNNQKYEASAYLADFAKLMRMILDNSRKQTVSLNEEVEFLQYYIRLEQLRFQKKFDFVINIDKGLDRGSIQVPSMFLQPFVENAILHGLAHLHTNGILTISFSYEEEGNSLRCIIQDNGIGRRKAEEIKAGNKKYEHHASAMQIINERLEMYNAANADKIYLSIEDIVDVSDTMCGTRIVINFPQ